MYETTKKKLISKEDEHQRKAHLLPQESRREELPQTFSQVQPPNQAQRLASK